MGTPVAEIITNYAMVEIDDLRLQRQLAEEPALFFRRMWLYVQNGIPLFRDPPEMAERLQVTPPEFGEYAWEGVSSSQPTEVQTGLTGFDMMSVSAALCGAGGECTAKPYTLAQYDPETGIVTFPPGVPEGMRFSMDFYKDGSFANDLGPDEKRILGLCTALVWYERFAANWLNLQPKISDRSFSVGSESAHIRAVTERLRQLRGALFDEIAKFGQDTAYRELLGRKRIHPFPIY